jgi:hypothetical protein
VVTFAVPGRAFIKSQSQSKNLNTLSLCRASLSTSYFEIWSKRPIDSNRRRHSSQPLQKKEKRNTKVRISVKPRETNDISIICQQTTLNNQARTISTFHLKKPCFLRGLKALLPITTINTTLASSLSPNHKPSVSRTLFRFEAGPLNIIIKRHMQTITSRIDLVRALSDIELVCV